MKINKPIRIILIDGAKEEFRLLNEIVGEQIKSERTNSQEITLLRSIKEKISILKRNPFYGDNIKKHLIPKKYDVPNLWREVVISLTQSSKLVELKPVAKTSLS